MKSQTMRKLKQVADEYDPNRDLDPKAPRVNWVEKALHDAIVELVAEIEQLKSEIQQLKAVDK